MKAFLGQLLGHGALATPLPAAGDAPSQEQLALPLPALPISFSTGTYFSTQNSADSLFFFLQTLKW